MGTYRIFPFLVTVSGLSNALAYGYFEVDGLMGLSTFNQVVPVGPFYIPSLKLVV